MIKVNTMNKYLEEYLKQKDYNEITEKAIAFVREWFAKNGPSSPAVIGISGGKDSSVTAALCAAALGKDRVMGVMMPNNKQSDIDVSKKLVAALGIPHTEINIKEGYDGIMNSITGAGFTPSEQAKINLGPRIRMSLLYAVSQSINGRVTCNGNRSERYVGYFTSFGDGAGDVALLANLTVHEVRMVGKCLGLADEFVYKAPADGLSGFTDEDRLGFTYEDLDTYILTGHCDDAEVKAKIDAKHNANLFKLSPITQFVF